MITINIYYKGTNGNAKRFAHEMEESGVVAKIRNEEGNIGYEYFYPANDDETVLLIDKWTNQSAIDAHHSSAMMSEIARLRDKYELTMEVERYVSQSLPSDDEKYIRKS